MVFFWCGRWAADIYVGSGVTLPPSSMRLCLIRVCYLTRTPAL